MLGIGQLERVSHDVVCGVSDCVDNEEALINKNDCQERKLRKLIVQTLHGRFLNIFSP